MPADTSRRVIAQRILTGEILHRDVPLTNAVTTRELSGPGGINGTIEPEMLQATARDGRPLIEEWSTALYVEEDQLIRHGAIVSHIDYDQSTQNLESTGFSGYPNGQPYAATYIPDSFPDPVDIIREVWRHLQSFPNGNLRITISGGPTWMVAGTSDGSFKIFDYDARDCGDLINSVVTTVPLDFLEQHQWSNDAHTTIAHSIAIGFPRLGRKRTDLRFAAGENILSHAAVGANGEDYSNDVYGLGEGSGISMLRSRQVIADGRLRRARAVSFRAAGKQNELDTKTKGELVRRSLSLDVTEVRVRDFPRGGVRIAAVNPGDDILAQLDVPWLGQVAIWLRVLGITENEDEPGIATFKTQRSDSFEYASAVSPTGEKVNIEL